MSSVYQPTGAQSKGKGSRRPGDEEESIGEEATSISGDINWVCCVCLHENTRCDGMSPCSACLAKGLNEQHCINGCQPCREARILCDGHKPCQNCQNRGKPCEHLSETVSTTTGRPEILDQNIHVTPPITLKFQRRTKDACVACRRDNKKCEVSRPCTRCVRRREECIGREKEPRTSKLRCQSCRLHKRRCGDRRPCLPCERNGLECVDVPRKGTGSNTRVKRACTECRRTKYQCDNERPCRNCVRRGFTCDLPALVIGARQPTGFSNVVNNVDVRNTAFDASLRSEAQPHTHTQMHQQGRLPPYQVLIPPIESLKDHEERARGLSSSAYPIDPRLLELQDSLHPPGNQDKAEGSSRGRLATALIRRLSSPGSRLSDERQTQGKSEDQLHSNQESDNYDSPEDDDDDDDDDDEL